MAPGARRERKDRYTPIMRGFNLELATIVMCLVLPAASAQCDWAWAGADFRADSPVAALCVWDPDEDGPLGHVLVVGGYFASIGGVSTNRVAIWDGVAWSAMGGNELVNGVTDLAVYRGNLYCAADALYKWNGSNWVWQSTAPIAIWRLLVVGDDLIIGGCFPGCIRRWDGTSSHEFGEGMADGYLGDDACVDHLAEFNGQIVAAGNFGAADGKPVGPVCRWTGATWEDLGVDAPGATCYSMTVFGSNVYAGLGGSGAPELARWNGEEWSEIGEIDDRVYHLAPFREQLLVSGVFDEPFGSVALLRQGEFAPMGAGLDHTLFDSLEFQGDLIVGGAFDTVDGMAISNFAIWEATLVGDANDDKLVDLADLGLVLAAYATCPGDAGYDPAAGAVSDDGDACVTLADLGVVLAAWGANCDPPPPAISIEPIAR